MYKKYGAHAINIIALILAAVSLVYAYRADAARVDAEIKQEQAEADARVKEERVSQLVEVNRELKAQLDEARRAILNFMDNYRRHVAKMDDAFSRYREVKDAEHRKDVIAEVHATIKYVQDWRKLLPDIENSLDGDVDNLERALQSGDLARMDAARRALEAGLESKFATLEQTLNQVFQDKGLEPTP